MGNENDFDGKSYAARVMKAKGYDPDASDEYDDIMKLQWPSWQNLFNRHRIGDDLSKAEQILTTFIQRETSGGPTKVIEAFAKHLDAQPKHGGSPDWTTATRELTECDYCENRGVVSNVPCRVRNKWGEEVVREYSFACVCDRGRYYAGMEPAQDWMLNFAADRRESELAKAKVTLKRFGIDTDKPEAEQILAFRAAIVRMKEQVASRRVTAKDVETAPIKPRDLNAEKRVLAAVKPPGAIDPETVEQARAMLAARKPTVNPPEQLNPDRLALAVYANGDERNEWE